MTFLNWLGISSAPNWTKARGFGALVGIVFGLLVFALFSLAVFAALRMLWLGVFSDLPQDGFARFGLSGVIVAMIGAPFVLWRSWVAQRQADTAAEGLITDRISKAVEGLGAEKVVNWVGRSVTVWIGPPEADTDTFYTEDTIQLPPLSVETGRFSTTEPEWDHRIDDLRETECWKLQYKRWKTEETRIESTGEPFPLAKGERIEEYGKWQVLASNEPNLEVRIGALYALERIAQDSLRDHIQIMEIICTYVRQNAPNTMPFSEPVPERRAVPRVDIQAAISVLGRRSMSGRHQEKHRQHRLDLRNCDLSGVDFQAGLFDGALFNQSKLEGAWLDRSAMKGASLVECNLRFATFWDADMTGARLDNSNISPTNKFNSLNRAKLTGACLFGTKMETAFMKTAFKKYFTIGNSDTVFNGYKKDELDHFMNLIDEAALIDDEMESRSKLDVGGLNYWSPYSNEDGTNHQILEQAKRYLGLTGFPYDDD